MKKSSIHLDVPVPPYDQTAAPTEPREGAFNAPTMTIPAQLSSVLMRGAAVVASAGNYRLDTERDQAGSKRIAVVGAVCNETLRLSPDLALDMGSELYLRGGRRFEGNSQRKTFAIDQNHPLCTLATLRFSDSEPPFLAEAKLPSTKHSSHLIFCRSDSSLRNTRHSLRSVPFSSQSRSLRHTVEPEPYSLGSSCHCAPVRSIHRIPSKQRRSSTRGRPPFGLTFGVGNLALSRRHLASESLNRAMSLSYC